MLTGQILMELIVILITVQVAGFLCRLIGQQWVIGEILAGLALGPSLLGLFIPGLQSQLFPASALSTLQVLGDIGLILYMFALGAHLDTGQMLRQSRTAAMASLNSMLLPFVLGALLGWGLYPAFAGPHTSALTFSLLVGTAMSITAFPVLARLLAEKDMLHSRIGLLALTCASAGDVVAWCLLAIIASTSHAQLFSTAALTVGETILFLAAMLLGVQPLLKRLVTVISSQSLQIAISLTLLLLAAFITNAIGIHPVFGAFIAGIIMPREGALSKELHDMDKLNNLLFLPIFFVISGLRTQLGQLQSPGIWLICGLTISIACFGKICGGTFSVRLMGEAWRDSLVLGFLMNTRGLVELIVLNVGYEMGILSSTMFAILVLMALVTTMITSPILNLLGYRAIRHPVTSTIADKNGPV
ncbi:cation:proton antiporter domain-containing protein [Dictyobacter aurantiacus]|uniref:Cation/H+ exchanger transmembrane domain-containing protein n=1 Tax=Dictyobacter aurantiacus TaxID=1936993 RepID=A0A401ZIT1_9CHLR|nr:cation:proton antiporter [Dictyobacter aurantiacus]GCE06755.1 hypothetical protein KDAU_40840 [Dictyobacter aurantiacus]